MNIPINTVMVISCNNVHTTSKSNYINLNCITVSSHVVTIFRHRQSDAPKWSCQTHRKRKNIFQAMSTSVLPAEDPRAWEWESSFLITVSEIVLVCSVFGGNQKRTSFLNWGRSVYTPIEVVIENAKILNLRNCIICTLWFLHNRLDHAACLLGLSCRDICHYT